MLAKRLHVSVGWAKKVSATFRRSGSWARPPAGPRGRRSKFTADIRRQVCEWIEEQPDLSLHELQSRLRGELGLTASIGRLWSLLRELGLRVKKVALRRRARYGGGPQTARAVARASEPDRPGKADFPGRKRHRHGHDPPLWARSARSSCEGRRAGGPLANAQPLGGDSPSRMGRGDERRGGH